MFCHIGGIIEYYRSTVGVMNADISCGGMWGLIIVEFSESGNIVGVSEFLLQI